MSSVKVTMPQLGETVAEGTVTRWLVAVGGEVRANEPLFEVSTDKVDTEVASPADGVLASVVVAEDETVPVGTVLATVETGDSAGGGVPDSDRTEYGAESAVPVAPAGGGSAARPAPDADRTEYRSGDPAAVAPSGAAHGPPRHRTSPRARRLARERGLHLADLVASGAAGRVMARDVPAAPRPTPVAAAAPAAAAPAPAPAAVPAPARTPAPRARGERVMEVSHRRRLIAERMMRSLHETAQLTTVVEVDLTRVVRAREEVEEEFRRRHGASLTVLAFVAEAAVRALGQHPVVNARLDLDAGTVTYPVGVDLGITVDTEKGLVVPVVRDAEDLSVGGLARLIAAAAAGSRDGSIGADEWSGGTFTVTDTGSRGVLFDTPILNPPESAILGLGAVVRRPVVLPGPDGEDRIAVRSMAYLALSYDHRLVDGADAARFLGSVKQRLEHLDAARADPVL